MKTRHSHTGLGCIARVFVTLLTAYTAIVAAQPSVVVPPRTLPGPFPVGCSNVAQDFGRLLPGEDVQTYWEGVPRNDGTPRYVTNLLSDPADTLAVTVSAPTDSNVYGSFAGQSIPYAILVCYPTSSENTRPNYGLPNAKNVPHMQQGTQAPLWPDTTTRFPVLLFSHGSLGSPLSSDYVDAVVVLASYGYVVAAPFHGDGRFGNLKADNLGDAVYLLTHLRDFLAMQALRPLSLSATLDALLALPQWRDRVDSGQVGGFGASLGAESLLLMANAGLTTSIGLSWTKVTMDPRLKAAVGYVPFFGLAIFPAFGREEHGLDDVALPFLAISGTADTTAPIFETALGMGRLMGPRELVALNGVGHTFDVASSGDIFTWTLTFLDAAVRGKPAAAAQLSQMASVAGGGDDHVVMPLQAPFAVNYGGQWWNSPPDSESGWGIGLAHQGDTIFATWFSYDAAGKAWWLSMTADKYIDGTYGGTLFASTGPPFFATPFDPAAVVRKPVGTGTLSFTDVGNGTFAYMVNGITQTKSIARQVFGPVPTCTFGSMIDPAQAGNYQDLWWRQPAGSEDGWGINLTQEGNTIFATWFTYDENGAPLWLSATATPTSSVVYAGVLYRSSGPAFSAVPFNPANVTRVAVGTITLSFLSGNSASFSYTLNGVSQTKSITREIFRLPGTVCK